LGCRFSVLVEEGRGSLPNPISNGVTFISPKVDYQPFPVIR